MPHALLLAFSNAKKLVQPALCAPPAESAQALAALASSSVVHAVVVVGAAVVTELAQLP